MSASHFTSVFSRTTASKPPKIQYFEIGRSLSTSLPVQCCDTSFRRSASPVPSLASPLRDGICYRRCFRLSASPTLAPPVLCMLPLPPFSFYTRLIPVMLFIRLYSDFLKSISEAVMKEEFGSADNKLEGSEILIRF
ncbi:hypothetical protein LXL04_033424 [Taraxacum kok-saghyz]